MKPQQRLDRLGIIFVIVFIMTGQLIWVMDPIRVGQHVFWIDMIDVLIYACLLPPLLWFFAALLHIKAEWLTRRYMNAVAYGSNLLLWLRLFIGCCSAVAIVYIVFQLQQFIIIGVSLGSAFLLVLTAMIVEKWCIKGRAPLIEFIKVALILALIAMLLFPTSYMVTYPGLTMNMQRYAQVEGQPSADANRSEPDLGKIMGVLVFERPAFPIDWLYSRMFPHYEFRKILPSDPSLGDQLAAVRIMKHGANQVGGAIAFEKVGIGRGVTYHGVRVVGIQAETPAATQLHVGDVIVQIDGQAVQTVGEFMQHMEKKRPGDELVLVVNRDNNKETVAIKTLAAASDASRAVIGIQIMDDTKLDLPLDVTFKPYLLHEGGPSHGAMLVLTLIDQLTPGGITHGHSIAGTGTIEIDGSIGRIGGIKQKAFIVERAGADVFFVPMGQEDEAREGAEHLRIIPVQTIDDILQWLSQPPAS